MANYTAGSLVFAHGKGAISQAIRFGEWLRWRGGAKWNHVAIFDRCVNGQWYVIQAEGKGVTDDKTLESVGESYEVLPCPQGIHPEEILHFARRQVGTKYGWATIASIIVDILTPERICLRKAGTFICSGLAATALLFAGWDTVIDSAKADIYQVSPAALYLLLQNPQ